MNIKDKLTFRFVLAFVITWGVASIAIYYSSAEFRKEEFYDRLRIRANTAAKLLIEVDEVDAELLQKIESANPVKLPGEKITIYDYDNQELFSTDTKDSIEMSARLFDKIRLENEFQWKQGNVEVLGLLYADKYDRFVVVTGASDLYGIRKLTNLRNILLIVFFISLILISLVARVYSGKALEPISEVIKEVNEIEINNLGNRVSEGNGQDEIATLGITFNHMLNRLQRAFETQKSFIANASHELRTPLTSMLSLVDVTLLSPRKEDYYRETLLSIKEDIHDLSELSSKLLLLARVESFREELTSIRSDTILWQAVSDISSSFKNQIHIDIDPGIDDESLFTIVGHEQLLKSAFTNIIENACKYSDNKEVYINISVQADRIHFEFVDHGVGITKKDMDGLFHPFFRGKNVSGYAGSGIGLNLVKKIIDIHKGSLDIHSTASRGTTVSVLIPHL